MYRVGGALFLCLVLLSGISNDKRKRQGGVNLRQPACLRPNPPRCRISLPQEVVVCVISLSRHKKKRHTAGRQGPPPRFSLDQCPSSRSFSVIYRIARPQIRQSARQTEYGGPRYCGNVMCLLPCVPLHPKGQHNSTSPTTKPTDS